MQPVRKITLVRTVEGRPTIYWPGGLLLFTILFVLWVLGQLLLDWAWTLVFQHGGHRSLLQLVGSGVFWTDVMMIWFVRSAWLREKARLDQVTPDPPIQPLGR